MRKIITTILAISVLCNNITAFAKTTESSEVRNIKTKSATSAKSLSKPSIKTSASIETSKSTEDLKQKLTPTPTGTFHNISIATGNITGIYYPAGGAICRLINLNKVNDKIKCAVEPSQGSMQNLEYIINGVSDLGISQSDWQYMALTKSGAFTYSTDTSRIRTLFNLYNENVTLIVSKDSGINEFNDLEGKTISIGQVGTGTRATVEEIMKAKKWNKNNFKKLVNQIDVYEQIDYLCRGEVDAIFFVAGHPNGLSQELTSQCQAKIIPIDKEVIDTLVAKYPYYYPTEIPAGMYVGQPNAIPSFGFKASLLATTDLSNEIAYKVVKDVFEKFDDFKSSHPILLSLDKSDIVNSSMVFPIHPGAAKYFKEVGLISQ